MNDTRAKITIGTFSSTTVLTLAFFGAKIFGLIDWSWWIVFSPLWVPWAIIFTILGVGAVLVFTFAAISVFLKGR